MSPRVAIDESDAAPLWIELRQGGGKVLRVAIRGPDDTRRLVELITADGTACLRLGIELDHDGVVRDVDAR